MSVPFTRTLPYVLRERLEASVGDAHALIGTVVSVPDPAHVRVDIQGAQVTIPKLADYSPVVGEPAYLVAAGSLMVALGSVKGTPPPGIANADTLDGYDSTAFWRKAEAVTAASATNADQLDSIDSTGFAKVPWQANTRLWQVRTTIQITGGSGTIAHPFGYQPGVLVQIHPPWWLSDVQRVETTATQIQIYCAPAVTNGAHGFNILAWG